jgi:hypothetical protein
MSQPPDPAGPDPTSEPPEHGPVPYPPPPAMYPPPATYAPPQPGYAQSPQYGQPGQYGQPAPYGGGYGAPQAYGQPAVRGTNTLAIVALVLAFVVPVAGVICGHLARKQIRETHEEGAGMATAALIIGYAFLALALIVTCAAIVVVVARANDTALAAFG